VRDHGLASIEDRLTELSARVDALTVERDEYRKLYLQSLELCRKLERGIVGPKGEKLSPGDGQLTMSLLHMMLDGGAARTTAPAEPPLPVDQTQVGAHTRAKPTGRKPLPEKLPRVDIEVLPPEVQQKGTDAFARIGEDVTETLERRPASLVVVRTHRPQIRAQGPRAQCRDAGPPGAPTGASH
jgi:transposase